MVGLGRIDMPQCPVPGCGKPADAPLVVLPGHPGPVSARLCKEHHSAYWYLMDAGERAITLEMLAGADVLEAVKDGMERIRKVALAGGG